MKLRMIVAMGTLSVLVAVGACGRSPLPNEVLATRWKENLDAPVRKQHSAAVEQAGSRGPKFLERTVEFFPDGTGVSRVVMEDTPQPMVTSFKWSLSADGRSLKTEDSQGTVLVAKIVALTEKELRIDEPSHSFGQYARDR